MRIFGIFSFILAFCVVIGSGNALAASCSAVGLECVGGFSSNRGNATQTADTRRPGCQKAASECKSRCSKGQKFFMSPFGGSPIPVDSCS
jgi:hypothetical protein